jgi:hypothetical protein
MVELAAAASTKPASPTTDDEDAHSPECRCSNAGAAPLLSARGEGSPCAAAPTESRPLGEPDLAGDEHASRRAWKGWGTAGAYRVRDDG